jgi:RNA polymerase sigma-70 factor (ECF subfamily)
MSRTPEEDSAPPAIHASGDVTRLLTAWTEGDPQALDELMPLVYAELHRIARRQWSAQPQGHTLQPTALIHEAYLKLVSRGDKTFQSRSHFFALASMAMRQILVNHAESSLAAKRGGDKETVSIDDVQPVVEEAREVLALHDALNRLAEIDPRKSRVVELRYFGGLSIEEAAEALGISAVTVTRDWQTARAWLARELGIDSAGPA